MTMKFSDRCAIATGCLPKAEYRTRLEALHAEMLAALDAPVAAPVAQPLTDAQLMLCLPPEAVRVPPGWREFARAIERAHGIAPKEPA